jgi:peptidyl-tRNA hydrolase, PTH1 family
MKLIVGLGNPGKRYEKTRHNVGFLILDAIAQQEKLKFSPKFKGLLAQTVWASEPVLLFKPETYMNLSGEAVRLVVEYFNLDIKDILVIYDDMDLPLGQIRLREKGGAGGHNGAKSLIQQLKTENFARCRIGIDKHPHIEARDYVLGHFTTEDLKVLEAKLPDLHNMCQDFVKKKFVDVMSAYNRKA